MSTTDQIGVLAMLDRAVEGLEAQNPSLLGRTTDVLVYPEDLRDVRDDVADLIDELAKATKIIAHALNHLDGRERSEFVTTLKAEGLDGIGCTRYHERTALLARIGGAA